jgi:hypothetical protein
VLRQISQHQAPWSIIAVMIGVDALWVLLGIKVVPNLWMIFAICGAACLILVYATLRLQIKLAVQTRNVTAVEDRSRRRC